MRVDAVADDMAEVSPVLYCRKYLMVNKQIEDGETGVYNVL